MKPERFQQLNQVQEHHWWFVHRRRLVAGVLDQALGNQVELALDIGCGAGSQISLLGHYARSVVGLDLSSQGIQLARARWPQGHYVCGDANGVGALFRQECFDLIGIFGVLYNAEIASPQDILHQSAGLLKPGGWVVITEGAFPFLFGSHDRKVNGIRRFWLTEMEEMLQKAGLTPHWSSCWNSFSFFPALALAWKERLTGVSGDEENSPIGEIMMPPPWLNQSIIAMMAPERFIIGKGWRLPLGVSLVCVAQKAGVDCERR